MGKKKRSQRNRYETVRIPLVQISMSWSSRADAAWSSEPMGECSVDRDGNLVELRVDDDHALEITYRDLPEQDRTIHDGMRCTTPLRTIIDLAPDIREDEVRTALAHCLDKGLFTVAEARARIEDHDMRNNVGAAILRRELPAE